MDRRGFLKSAAAASLGLLAGTRTSAWAANAVLPHGLRDVRPRPGEPGWPDVAEWARLDRAVGGRLLQLQSPFAACTADTLASSCRAVLQQLGNPFYLGDQPALTQSSGWIDAWVSQPSAYAVVARSAADVAAAVAFASRHRLRLVVKGGGHSYQGTSDAPDSLLVWTRHLRETTLHDAFVASGCEGSQAPQAAVTLGAGAMWIDAYDAVTTRGGRYVQGGGCTTVGVPGLIQSGGFGSFSKRYGLAAAGLLEAEIVTADGTVRTVNARRDPELFWALKGGGGGSFGVITRLTLRMHDLPADFGGVFGAIEADTDADYRTLVTQVMAFYRRALFNPQWGEQLRFHGRRLTLHMVFQGLDQAQAQSVWEPFFEWVRAHKGCRFVSAPRILAVPAQHFWDAGFWERYVPSLIVPDHRPDAPSSYFVWAGDRSQAGQFMHGYQSAWLPQALLREGRLAHLVDALCECARSWEVALHFNKGLAGAPAEAVHAARDTATHPQVLDAFALAIIAGGGPPAYPGMPGPGPDLAGARRAARRIRRAMAPLRRLVPGAGSYIAESDFFQNDWHGAFWGPHYARLRAAKDRYDPEGLFTVHHGVGSEDWSEDGFRRLRNTSPKPVQA